MNQEVLLRATFLVDRPGFFFALRSVMNGVPLACGYRFIEGEGHDEDQAVEAVSVAELGILDAQAARFEVLEHRLDDAALRVLKGPRIAGLFPHGDYPGLGVTRILHDADVGPGSPTGEFDIFQIVDLVLGTLSGRRLARAVEHHEVALEPQPIVPGPLLAPARSDRRCRKTVVF